MKRILVAAFLVIALSGCGPNGSQLAQEASEAAGGDIPVKAVTATEDGRVTMTLSIPRGFLGDGANRRCSDMANSVIAKVDGVKSVKVIDGNGETIGEYQKQ